LRSPSQTDSVTPRSFQDPCQTGIFKGRLSEGGGGVFFSPTPPLKNPTPLKLITPTTPTHLLVSRRGSPGGICVPLPGICPGARPPSSSVPSVCARAPSPTGGGGGALGRSVGRSDQLCGALAFASPGPQGVGTPPLFLPSALDRVQSIIVR